MRRLIEQPPHVRLAHYLAFILRVNQQECGQNGSERYRHMRTYMHSSILVPHTWAWYTGMQGVYDSRDHESGTLWRQSPRRAREALSRRSRIRTHSREPMR